MLSGAPPRVRCTPRRLEAIGGPLAYLLGACGKGRRSTVIDAFASVLPATTAAHLAAVKDAIESLHAASLLLDDIQDGSPMRRGQPSAHCRYGVPLTINAASAATFDALARILAVGAAEGAAAALATTFAEEMAAMYRGQGLEILHRDTQECPTRDEYFYIIANKTGGLFRLAVRLLLGLSPAASRSLGGQADLLVGLAEEIGILYQLCDDYHNLHSRAAGAPLATDVTEGKFTLPAIATIAGDAAAGARLCAILAMRTADAALKDEALCLMAAALEGEHVAAVAASSGRIAGLVAQAGCAPLCAGQPFGEAIGAVAHAIMAAASPGLHARVQQEAALLATDRVF